MAATTARRGLRRDQESLRRIVVTTGEPAGIGPDLALAAALADWPCELVFAGDPELLAARAVALGLPLKPVAWREDAPPAAHRAGRLPVLALPLAREATPGRPDAANARYVLATIDAAADGCIGGRFAAMVTAPVQKSAILDAGIAFQGHTEYLAARSGGAHPVMLLVTGKLRVALATTHLPLAAVPRAITRDLVERTLALGGTFYLPYRLHYTPEQFRRGYPTAPEFLELKRRVDPEELFSSRFYEHIRGAH